MRDGLLALLGVAAASGCSYDWAVVQGADAAGDVSFDVEAAVMPDASLDGSTDSPEVAPEDAPADVMEAAPPSCATLETQIQQTRAAALACSGTSACQTEVTDECGCMVVVGEANTTTPTENYLAAIAQ
jgi:hypothetical protein